MEEISVNKDSLLILLQFLGFNIVDDLENNEVRMKSKNFEIKLKELQISNENQKEAFVIPELNEENKKQVHGKLISIFDLISVESGSNVNSTVIPKIRRGSSINVSKSFTVNHNVVVNLETTDVCTSPVNCSSPIISRIGKTPSKANKSITDMLIKARNFIDMAMGISSKSSLCLQEMGLNSTFTKDQTVEQARNSGPRISNIKASPLKDSKAADINTDGNVHFMDITNLSSASQMSAPKELIKEINSVLINEKKISSDKKCKYLTSKIGIVKQCSKANGTTSIRNSPLDRFKKNHIDTPRPLDANKSRSATNLASPYLRTTPRLTTNSNNNTPSPRCNNRLVVESNKLNSISGLRKPGWFTKK